MQPSVFFRLHTDQTRTPVPLEDTFAGPTRTACWLIGGGPSLNALPWREIRDSAAPKMAINLSGTRLLRPTFWTSYDPSVRFHRSVYLDAGVMKFVHRRRAMDLVPETTFKVCDCPNTYFFERDGARGFADFLSRGHGGIVDWADSMVQAIDILYRLGFRVVFLAGCEMRVRPSREQIAAARRAGVRYDPQQPLADFVRRCEEAGLSADRLDEIAPARQYHFDEFKPMRAAVSTDGHYFRIAQMLRLCRRSMSLAGFELISVTPHSRLNDYFRYVPVRQALAWIRAEVGDPRSEPVRGLYRQTLVRHRAGWGPMRDFRPPNWKAGRPPSPPENPAGVGARGAQPDAQLLVEGEGFTKVDSPRPGDERPMHAAPGRPIVCEEG